jgi:hypothetical protein
MAATVCALAIISTNTGGMSDISFSQLTCTVAGLSSLTNDTAGFVRADIASFEGKKHILSSRMHGGGLWQAN